MSSEQLGTERQRAKESDGVCMLEAASIQPSIKTPANHWAASE